MEKLEGMIRGAGENRPLYLKIQVAGPAHESNLKDLGFESGDAKALFREEIGLKP